MCVCRYTALQFIKQKQLFKPICNNGEKNTP